MSNKSIINKMINVYVHEPEEFFFSNGDGPFSARITSVQGGCAFFRTEKLLEYEDKKTRFFAMSARHVGEPLEKLETEQGVVVNIAPIFFENDIENRSEDELTERLKLWRGNHLVGTAELMNSA